MSVADEKFGEDSFEAIEAAVLKSPKGRWFLDEYARRLRSSETVSILDAIKRLERAVAASPPQDAATLKPSQLKYFKDDEDIFVQAKLAAPALSVVDNAQSRPDPRGAHVKIERVKAPMAETPPADVMTATPKPAAGEPKQRVVIIKKAPGEELSIPMVDSGSA
jgi:hypothetical protein